MRIGRDHQKLSAISRDFCVEALAEGNVAGMVTRALESAGHLGGRRSPLHPRLVLWLVVGLMLWRSEAIPAVFGRLLSGLRERWGKLSLKAVSEGALAHARRRLGVEPLRAFFRQLGAEVAPLPSFKDLKVWIIDGTRLTLQDTPANLKVFGRRKASRGRAAFCEIGMVCLVEATGHLIRDAVFGLWKLSESKAAHRLIRHLAAGDLVILDRLFHSLRLYKEIREREAHFLCRVSSKPTLKPIRGTRQGHQYDAWMCRRIPCRKGEGRSWWCSSRVVRLRVRVIDYRLKGYGRIRLVTSLMDRVAYPAEEIALLYHTRWEVEIAFDEIKTHQNANAHGQLQTVFRSKTPRNVMQEAYALLVAYNLVRRTMAQSAERSGLNPLHLSFLGSLRAIHHMVPRMQAGHAERLPRLHAQLLQDIAEAELDRPRRGRAYPRVVRVKMSKFKLKRQCHHQIRRDFAAMVRSAAA
jgi:hypothetical protein